MERLREAIGSPPTLMGSGLAAQIQKLIRALVIGLACSGIGPTLADDTSNPKPAASATDTNTGPKGMVDEVTHKPTICLVEKNVSYHGSTTKIDYLLRHGGSNPFLLTEHDVKGTFKGTVSNTSMPSHAHPRTFTTDFYLERGNVDAKSLQTGSGTEKEKCELKVSMTVFRNYGDPKLGLTQGLPMYLKPDEKFRVAVSMAHLHGIDKPLLGNGLVTLNLGKYYFRDDFNFDHAQEFCNTPIVLPPADKRFIVQEDPTNCGTKGSILLLGDLVHAQNCYSVANIRVPSGQKITIRCECKMSDDSDGDARLTIVQCSSRPSTWDALPIDIKRDIDGTRIWKPFECTFETDVAANELLLTISVGDRIGACYIRKLEIVADGSPKPDRRITVVSRKNSSSLLLGKE